MNIETKFQLGDIIMSHNKKYMGLVTNLNVTLNDELMSIEYTIKGNEQSYKIKESDAQLLHREKPKKDDAEQENIL